MNKLLIKLVFLVAILAIAVNCSKTENRAHKKAGRGIVLKCQGNAISCYGKRSSVGAEIYGDEDSSNENLEDQFNQLQPDLSAVNVEDYMLEREFQVQVRNCKLNIRKSCIKMMEMLINSNKK